MKKLLPISVLIILATIAFFAYKKLDSEGFFMSKEEKYFYQKLKEFKDSGKDSIHLKELTNFEWEYVCYMGPYSGIDDKRFEGVILNKEIPEDDNDGKFAIIFIREGVGKVFRASRTDFSAQEECSDVKIAELKRCAESSFFKQGKYICLEPSKIKMKYAPK
jgi:hypothetical protein